MNIPNKGVTSIPQELVWYKRVDLISSSNQNFVFGQKFRVLEISF